MTPALVVDIGNTRMKWGRVVDAAVANLVSLPHDDPEQWRQQLKKWTSPNNRWLIGSVVPKAARRVQEWLRENAIDATVLDHDTFFRAAGGYRNLADNPHSIGIDRLVNAFAAHKLTGTAAAVVSVGTAMTVDFISPAGEHRCSAILPGPRLMAKSLNDYTALLPLVEAGRFLPSLACGTTTEENMRLGITRAIVHTADGLIHDWYGDDEHDILLTGGDAALFREFVFSGGWREVRFEPNLTLEGLRLVAEAMP